MVYLFDTVVVVVVATPISVASIDDAVDAIAGVPNDKPSDGAPLYPTSTDRYNSVIVTLI